MDSEKLYINSITDLNTENTLAILPIALILLRMTSFRRLAAAPKIHIKNMNNFIYK